MTARLKAPAAPGRCAVTHVTTLLIVLSGFAAAAIAPPAGAQQAVNPGDIIVERTITPRSAFASVPKDEDPVAVRATTFPKNSFDPMMASLVSDTDLTNVHGSSGVPGGMLNNTGAGMQAVTRILSGNATGANTALGATPGSVGGVGGIGSTVSSTVTGALAPLSAALSGSPGGLK
jgi:hypothetical protein